MTCEAAQQRPVETREAPETMFWELSSAAQSTAQALHRLILSQHFACSVYHPYVAQKTLCQDTMPGSHMGLLSHV